MFPVNFVSSFFKQSELAFDPFAFLADELDDLLLRESGGSQHSDGAVRGDTDGNGPASWASDNLVRL